jgi:two-component system sensor histidine kinase PilS (NtrC family)
VAESERRRRLIWLIWARVFVSTLLMGSAVIFQITKPGSLPIDPFFFLIGLTYSLSVLYVTSLSYVDRYPWLIDLQFMCDATIVTAFIYFTGGVTSYFALLYVLPIIGVASLKFRSGSMRVAVLSAAQYTGLVVVAYMGGPGYIGGLWMHDMRPLLPPLRVAALAVGADSTALIAVALLAGSLAERLQNANARLEDASLALADLQAFNQHVIDSMTSGLVTTDRVGRILTFNPAAEAIVGRGTAQVVGLRVADVLRLPEEFTSLLARDLAGDRARRADYTYRTGDGATLDIGISATHLVTPDGHAGFLLTFQDVTEMRRLEREARMRQRLAAVGEMAAGIAHEIRNPLASIRGSIQVLRAELGLSEEQARLMDIVMRESDRLNDTIRSFLSYARPQPLSAGPVDAGRLLRDTAILLRNSPEVLPAHRIDVDAPDAGPIANGDDGQMRQVVWNLATNGLRAMPEGGRLVLRARADGPSEQGELRVALEVADEGVGIAPEQLDTLFQPFHGSFARGSGLGLAIVHRIVSDHHGEVRVESEVGKGTTVTVRLPGTTASAGAAAGEAGAAGGAGGRAANQLESVGQGAGG